MSQCRKCLSWGYCYFPEDCGRDRVTVDTATCPETEDN